MSEDRLVEVRERHQQSEMVSRTASGTEYYLACKRCREPWPCDAVAMADEVERLRAEVKDHGWLIERQRQAMLPADRLWQEAHNTKTYPGLTELIEWLVTERWLSGTG